MARRPTSFDDKLHPGRARPGERHRWKPGKARLAATRRAVYKRDGWTCQGCALTFPHDADEVASGRFAPAILGPKPDHGFSPVTYLELHHVVPYRHGGAFRVANLMALCSTCNVRGAYEVGPAVRA